MANPTCAFCGAEAELVDAVLKRPSSEDDAATVEVVCRNPDCPGPDPQVVSPKD